MSSNISRQNYGGKSDTKQSLSYYLVSDKLQKLIPMNPEIKWLKMFLNSIRMRNFL